MWEQLSLASFLQRHWADNQVSCTVTFDPKTESEQLKPALDVFQYQLKGGSFLPRLEEGAFPQMPYEAIDEDVYRARVNELTSINFDEFDSSGSADTIEVPDKFCDGDSCSI